MLASYNIMREGEREIYTAFKSSPLAVIRVYIMQLARLLASLSLKHTLVIPD